MIRNHSKGVTLLEILLYVALFSLCFSTIGQVSLSAQKVAQKISEERRLVMLDAYVEEYASASVRSSGEFSSRDQIGEFIRRIVTKMDFPAGAFHDGSLMIFVELNDDVRYVNESHRASFQKIQYSIGNSQRSLMIYLL